MIMYKKLTAISAQMKKEMVTIFQELIKVVHGAMHLSYAYISKFIVENYNYQYRFHKEDNRRILYRIVEDNDEMTEIDEWKCDLYRLLYLILRKYCTLLEIDYFDNPKDFLFYIQRYSRDF